jgi:hypothetical protein
MVFNDVNGDGVQEENEPGLAGIAVMVATSSQAHTLITDASGAYQVNANPRATVRIRRGGWSRKPQRSHWIAHATSRCAKIARPQHLRPQRHHLCRSPSRRV